MADVTFAAANDLVRLIKTRAISSAELLEHYLARIDKYNEPINAVIASDPDGARQRAKAADAALARGEDWGPLHGLPMTVKESYDVAGYRTTWGIPEMKNNVATRDALSITRSEECRRRDRRQNERAAAPRRFPELQRHLRHDEQSVGQGPHPRRLVGRFRRGIGGRLDRPRNRLRHRRVHPQSGAFLRRIRPQTDVESAAAARPRDAGHSVAGGHFGHRTARHVRRATSKPPLLVMAGPDEIQSRGYTLSLPRLGKPVSALRVGVWSDDPIAPVSKAVRNRVEAVGPRRCAISAPPSMTRRAPTSRRTAHTTHSSSCCRRRCPRHLRRRLRRRCAMQSRRSRRTIAATAPTRCARKRRRSATGIATTRRARVCAGRGRRSSTSSTCC